jgi:hypothetical protein
MIQQSIKAALVSMVVIAIVCCLFASRKVRSFTTPRAFAQTDEKCRGPIYSGNEVSKRAKITAPADLETVYKAFGSDVQGHAIVEAVLCRTGHVTDIKAVDISPPKITQFVVAAISQIEFKPAERNWHTVSQNIRFEYRLNENEPSPIDQAKAAGRLIEELDVMGNRRLTKEEVMARIKSRPGEVYNSEQIQKDLLAILATGNFDAISTRVLLDDAPRGGVRLMFEVHELPLITEVRFEGLKENDRSAIVEELRKQNVGVEKGAPLDPAKLQRAKQVINQFFATQGWREVATEVWVEETSRTESTIIFKINAYRFP